MEVQKPPSVPDATAVEPRCMVHGAPGGGPAERTRRRRVQRWLKEEVVTHVLRPLMEPDVSDGWLAPCDRRRNDVGWSLDGALALGGDMSQGRIDGPRCVGLNRHCASHTPTAGCSLDHQQCDCPTVPPAPTPNTHISAKPCRSSGPAAGCPVSRASRMPPGRSARGLARSWTSSRCCPTSRWSRR